MVDQKYVLVTDSACDILPEILKEWGVELIRMPFLFTDTSEEQLDHDMPIKEFYDSMRSGRIAKTSGINEYVFHDVFTSILEEGKDILYIAFSGGMSITYGNGKRVAEEMAAQYPDRKIYVVDTLAASAGEGMLVYFASKNREAGMTLEENVKAIEEDKLHICHWFTVDDLVYLKRGGRVSAATALIGAALNVKPVLHVDNDGHLIKMSQVRGRKKSIRAMAEKLGETILPDSPIFISHGDCITDAELLREILESEYEKKVQLITNVGSLIGAHSGPGTLALFFRGTER